MKNLLNSTILTAVLIFPSSAMAGEDSSCHFHGNKIAKEEIITNCAIERKERLITQGKIEPESARVFRELLGTCKRPRSRDAIAPFLG